MEMFTPLYLEIRAALEFEILSGRIQPGQEIPSLRALAEQYHVNGSTARYALAGLRRAALVIKPRRGEPLRVTSDTELIASLRQKKIDELTEKCIRQLKLLGCSAEIKTLLLNYV